MKKEGETGVKFLLIFIIALSLLLNLSLVLAAENVTDTSKDINQKAIDCINNKVKNNCDSLSVEEQAFAVLATGKCKSEFTANSLSSKCWPESSCTIRDTSIAVLALNGKSEAEKWLLQKNITTPDLRWYLQIDADSETKCSIKYDSKEYKVTITEDKKFSQNAGNCLTRAKNNYWLEISSPCINKNITISCDKDFLSNSVYSKRGEEKYYISSETESASADGEVQLKTESLCFSVNNKCDYEGSLWATLVLQKEKYDIDAFLPYLIAYSEDNKRLGSYAFLYLITGYEEYYSKLLESQKDSGYFDFSSPYKKNYDTALAMLSLSSSSAGEIASAKEWLKSSQSSDGCWGSLRDTSFLLYAGWPRASSPDNPDVEYCTTNGKYCVSKTQCDTAGGEIVDEFYCSGTSVCCTKQKILESCSQQNGLICTSSELCESPVVPASDGSCCLSKCSPKQAPTSNECSQYGYFCRTACFDDETNKDFSCSSSYEVCCGSGESGSSGFSWWWIILLIGIIVLALLIIFRKRIFKGGFKSGQISKTSPPYPPAAGSQRPGFRPVNLPSQRQAYRPMQRPMPSSAKPRAGSRDKELEETLKKLKDMSR